MFVYEDSEDNIYLEKLRILQLEQLKQKQKDIEEDFLLLTKSHHTLVGRIDKHTKDYKRQIVEQNKSVEEIKRDPNLSKDQKVEILKKFKDIDSTSKQYIDSMKEELKAIDEKISANRRNAQFIKKQIADLSNGSSIKNENSGIKA